MEPQDELPDEPEPLTLRAVMRDVLITAATLLFVLGYAVLLSYLIATR